MGVVSVMHKDWTFHSARWWPMALTLMLQYVCRILEAPTDKMQSGNVCYALSQTAWERSETASVGAIFIICWDAILTKYSPVVPYPALMQLRLLNGITLYINRLHWQRKQQEIRSFFNWYFVFWYLIFFYSCYLYENSSYRIENIYLLKFHFINL